MSEIKNLNITKCLNCNKSLIGSYVLCHDCYKLNLNTIYKAIKLKAPENIDLLKEFVKNEKYSISNIKPKVNVLIEHKKFIIEY
jgi:hypothetical protein